MNNNLLKELLEKYKLGTLSAEEIELLESWYLREAASDDREIDVVELINANAEIWKEVYGNIDLLEQEKRQITRSWPRIITVVAAMVSIVFGVYVFLRPRQAVTEKPSVVFTKDIAPGKKGATITLPSGELLQLSNNKNGVLIGKHKLAYKDGTDITASQLGRSKNNKTTHNGPTYMLTAATARGQTYEFTLPDGSQVWLNANSVLKIPANFSQTKKRKVHLEGEAYFKVAKNKKRPFVVETSGQEVEVLGTQFNINTYPDEGAVKTTLTEGRVRVLPKRNVYTTDGVELMPGQQSILTTTGNITVQHVDTETELAWKDNKFMFKRESIEGIMTQLARWYDVKIIYEGDRSTEKFVGCISRLHNLSAVLELLASTGSVHFKIVENRVYVSQ